MPNLYLSYFLIIAILIKTSINKSVAINM